MAVFSLTVTVLPGIEFKDAVLEAMALSAELGTHISFVFYSGITSSTVGRHVALGTMVDNAVYVSVDHKQILYAKDANGITPGWCKL